MEHDAVHVTETKAKDRWIKFRTRNGEDLVVVLRANRHVVSIMVHEPGDGFGRHDTHPRSASTDLTGEQIDRLVEELKSFREKL